MRVWAQGKRRGRGVHVRHSAIPAGRDERPALMEEARGGGYARLSQPTCVLTHGASTTELPAAWLSSARREVGPAPALLKGVTLPRRAL